MLALFEQRLGTSASINYESQNVEKVLQKIVKEKFAVVSVLLFMCSYIFEINKEGNFKLIHTYLTIHQFDHQIG